MTHQPVNSIAANEVVARISIHHINQQNRYGAIGYWLGQGFTGNGIITQSCQSGINYSVTAPELNRIEIKCGTENSKSAVVAERLHFKKEGLLRQAEWINGRFIDLYLLFYIERRMEQANY